MYCRHSSPQHVVPSSLQTKFKFVQYFMTNTCKTNDISIPQLYFVFSANIAFSSKHSRAVMMDVHCCLFNVYSGLVWIQLFSTGLTFLYSINQSWLTLSFLSVHVCVTWTRLARAMQQKVSPVFPFSFSSCLFTPTSITHTSPAHTNTHTHLPRMLVSAHIPPPHTGLWAKGQLMATQYVYVC